LDLSVTLIEQERIGGVCLNRGCIPTKALLSDVEGLRWIQRAREQGIVDRIPDVRVPAVMDRASSVVEKMVADLEAYLVQLGVTIVPGRAALVDDTVVEVDSKRRVTASAIVMATGSRPALPNIPGIELPGVMTSRSMLQLQTCPQHLIIIGGGIVGQEFAEIFAGLGARVTVLEALPRILPYADHELVKRYLSLLPGRGIRTELGAAVQGIRETGGKLAVTYVKKDEEKVGEADVVLVAAGRRPVLADGVGERLELSERDGSIAVDPDLRTSLDHVYAVGDVTGDPMLAHVAAFQGEAVAERIGGYPRDISSASVPNCLYTDPQIAWVGLTEKAAVEQGLRFRSSIISLSANGKARAMGENRGWVKLLEAEDTGRLLGAHILGPQASEMISLLTLAMDRGISVADLSNTIIPHPTLSEGVREAAMGFLFGAIHTASRVKAFTP
jgi:dihydrolipoamide dehydrogenase